MPEARRHSRRLRYLPRLPPAVEQRPNDAPPAVPRPGVPGPLRPQSLGPPEPPTGLNANLVHTTLPSQRARANSPRLAL
eukprot:9005953-Alexandrium_andersonii.AAC.1